MKLLIALSLLLLPFGLYANVELSCPDGHRFEATTNNNVCPVDGKPLSRRDTGNTSKRDAYNKRLAEALNRFASPRLIDALKNVPRDICDTQPENPPNLQVGRILNFMTNTTMIERTEHRDWSDRDSTWPRGQSLKDCYAECPWYPKLP